MRIWHEALIPILCRQHLLAMWREGLGAYSIIVHNKTGYRNHPAVREFAHAPNALYNRLAHVRREMINRGYHPKPLPAKPPLDVDQAVVLPWQSLAIQRTILQSKNCQCMV